MKYAITYYNKFNYLEEIDEIILYWSTKDNIVDYIESKYKLEQRIIISINDYTNFIKDILPIIVELKKKHNNISIRFDNGIPDDEILNELTFNKIRYYFNQFCSSWDIVYGLVAAGASDLIVTEELCFDLKAVSAFCKPRNVKIRVFPNIAQVSGIGLSKYIPDIYKFFIRPEDTKVYEPYVDVFEFWGELSKQNVYYEIYKRQEWIGNLNELIIDFKTDAPNLAFMEHFAGCRLSCKKKCLQGSKKCNICDGMRALAISLNNRDLMFDDDDDLEEED